MKQFFKVGHIVQYGTFVASIEKIEGENVYLNNKHVTQLERLAPVKIRGGFDTWIVLDNNNPVRASITPTGESVPTRSKPKLYLESDIDGKNIVSIIETNGFRFIHELQDWIAKNAPDYFLRTIV